MGICDQLAMRFQNLQNSESTPEMALWARLARDFEDV